MKNANMLILIKRFLDSEAYALKMWFDMCENRDELKHVYQAQYNQIVNIREKLVIETIEQFSRPEMIFPEATSPIYIT